MIDGGRACLPHLTTLLSGDDGNYFFCMQTIPFSLFFHLFLLKKVFCLEIVSFSKGWKLFFPSCSKRFSFAISVLTLNCFFCQQQRWDEEKQSGKFVENSFVTSTSDPRCVRGGFLLSCVYAGVRSGWTQWPWSEWPRRIGGWVHRPIWRAHRLANETAGLPHLIRFILFIHFIQFHPFHPFPILVLPLGSL